MHLRVLAALSLCAVLALTAGAVMFPGAVRRTLTAGERLMLPGLTMSTPFAVVTSGAWVLGRKVGRASDGGWVVTYSTVTLP